LANRSCKVLQMLEHTRFFQLNFQIRCHVLVIILLEVVESRAFVVDLYRLETQFSVIENYVEFAREIVLELEICVQEFNQI